LQRRSQILSTTVWVKTRRNAAQMRSNAIHGFELTTVAELPLPVQDRGYCSRISDSQV
jgi:hypothetical protein